MRFNTYFKSASYLLAFSAFLSLALTGEVEPPYVIVIILGMAFGLVQERIDLSLLSKSLVIISIPFLPLDFFLLSKDILLAFTHLLILLAVARLLSLRTNSDYSQLYLLTFFELLASSALTINLSFAFTFTLYLISATWVLLLFHIKKEVEGKGEERQERELEGAVTPPFFLGIGGVAVLSLTFTLAIFFVLPRVGVGLFFKRPGKAIKTTGFGDKVDFGQIGPVTLDPTTVMRVEIPESEKGLGVIYLRGTVMDFFNGISWEKERRETAPLDRSGSDFFLYKSAAPLVRQEIILEPIDSKVIFGMYRIARLSGRFQALFADGYDAVYLAVNPTSRFQYTVYSDIRMPKAAELDADRGPYPKDILDSYTRLPPLSEGVRGLALSITGREEGPYKKALAAEGYLKKNYSYTLSPGRDEKLPPVEDFLFRNREGYCDHFSTAMVILLREVGIPTRLVTGYVTSEWNDLGRFYTVRQSNAHSWVEVYFPSSGWVPFGPTPAAPSRKENIIAGRIGRYMGYIRLKWDRYIINFTLQDQVKAAREARRRTESGREALLNLIKSLRGKVKSERMILPAAILAVAIFSYIFLIRKRRKSVFGPVRKKGLVPFYEEMLRILARKGIMKPEGMTPREFARHVYREKGYSGVIELTEAFERVRYGGFPLGPGEPDSINRILEGMRKV